MFCRRLPAALRLRGGRARHARPSFRRWQSGGVAAAILAVIGLIKPVSAASPIGADLSHSPSALAQQLVALSPGVRAHEAQRLADEAHISTKHLAREYGAAVSPQFHNFLVNAGLKRRGLCHHWARDLGGRLAALKLRTLVLRWGIARRGTLREHNAVVVTARGQPFERGIVLDAWRHPGRLFSSPVIADKYPWKEDPLDTFTPSGGDGSLKSRAARD